MLQGAVQLSCGPAIFARCPGHGCPELPGSLWIREPAARSTVEAQAG